MGRRHASSVPQCPATPKMPDNRQPTMTCHGFLLYPGEQIPNNRDEHQVACCSGAIGGRPNRLRFAGLVERVQAGSEAKWQPA